MSPKARECGVTVTGAKFSKGDLKKLIPVYQEGAVDAEPAGGREAQPTGAA